MKKLLLLTILTTILFADIKIITSNKSPIKGISREDLAKIYLKKKDTINGIKVIPIDNKDSYNEFCKKVIKKTPKQLRAYWMKEIYRGDKQPPQKLSTTQIKERMQKNPKIISYTSSKLTGKVIFTIK
ncbi:MAG: hypothetical protein KAU90_06415 [Sulfurovaceae bacterium]|nr:hypothetical protein [Sulfurovaceae bacterium]